MSLVWFAALGLAGLLGLTWGWAADSPPLLAGAAMALGGLALGIAATAGLSSRRASGSPSRSRTASSEVLALRRDADEARAELDAIQSSVSHDLRSPIGAALNFLTVLEEDHGAQLDADGRAILARVRRSNDSALALLDGLARLARVGRQPMAPRLVDVDGLVRSAFAAVRPVDRIVELTIVEPLPSVFGDPELLRVAFGELLANAVRFTAGSDKASVTVGGGSDGNGSIDYWVADDGIGFDPRYAGKLFHLFERLHSREEFPGAGAGLAIVRRVAERHGGSVRADAALRRGATFHLSLPKKPYGRLAVPELAT